MHRAQFIDFIQFATRIGHEGLAMSLPEVWPQGLTLLRVRSLVACHWPGIGLTDLVSILKQPASTGSHCVDVLGGALRDF